MLAAVGCGNADSVITTCASESLPVGGSATLTTGAHESAQPQTTAVNTEPEIKEPTMGNPMYTEMWRPSYHFTTKNSWINDPNGLTYFKGVYHIYYQTNPGSNLSGNVHWGHATSQDLVHFEEHAPVLFPDSSGHMWSGTTYVDTENRSGLFDGAEGGGIIAAYSTNTQKIGIAYSKDGFSFKKLGIVIDNTSIEDFRDPKLFYDKISGKWTMVVAGGKVRFYQSSDLRSWTLASENEIYTECPDFFPMNIEGVGKTMWVLTCGGRHAYVGEWDGRVFTVKSSKIPMNYGPDSYAGIIFSADREDRTLMLSWMNNWSYTQPADGIWAGANTLVHSLSLVKNKYGYRIIQTPIKEYETIYGETVTDIKDLAYSGKNPFEGVDSQSYVLKMKVDLSQDKDFTLNFYDGKNDKVTLSVDALAKKISVSRAESVLGIDPMKTQYASYSFVLANGFAQDNMLDLEIYVDTSSIEIYAAGYSHVFSMRTQPMTSSRGLSIEAEEGLVIKSASVTYLKNIHFEEGEEIDAVHISKSEITLVANGNNEEFINVFALGQKGRFSAVSENDKIATVRVTDGGITVKGVSAGNTYIRIESGSVYVRVLVKVVEKDSFSSQLTSFTVSGGTLSKGPLGYTLKSSGGDSFALSDVYLSDFEYSADVSFPKNGGAAALVFRATDLSNFYCLCLDRGAGVVKIWTKKNGAVTDIKTVSYRYAKDRVYSVRLVAVGEEISAYINGELVISISDIRHTEGVIGINAYKTEAVFNNIKYSTEKAPDVNVDSMIESFIPLVGSLVRTDKGYMHSNSAGDGFVSSSVIASDFTYTASVRVSSGTPAAALVFRMNGTADFYCATVDVGARIIKLWKRVASSVTVVKTVSLELEWDKEYKLSVSAVGDNIKISVDGREVMSVSDSSHKRGALGLNVFRGSAYFNRIEYDITKE